MTDNQDQAFGIQGHAQLYTKTELIYLICVVPSQVMYAENVKSTWNSVNYAEALAPNNSLKENVNRYYSIYCTP